MVVFRNRRNVLFVIGFISRVGKKNWEFTFGIYIMKEARIGV